MKQKMILQILLVLLSIHDIMYMPLQTSILTFLGAFALYGLTNELLVPVFILFMSPLIVLSVKMYKKGTEGFQQGKAEEISDRVKGMQTVVAPPASGPFGVLGMPNVENFQDVNNVSQVVDSAPAVSVPAFVKDKGRMLLVPENAVANSGSLDKNPQANPALITGHDTESVNTALVADATQLGNAAQPASAVGMSVGPTHP